MALKKEIFLQKNFFPFSRSKQQNVSTVYFGGGTPSLLSYKELMEIIDELNKHFNIAADAELTVEANPDDLTAEKIKQLKNTPINRLSIGVQSFFDGDLRYMNRSHTAKQAAEAVLLSQDNGFSNITIDLIYGMPLLNNEAWLANLNKTFNLNVQHISCYALTVEPKTALAHFIKTGKLKNVDENQAAQQFELTLDAMKKNNFIQYEISNFCKENYYSRHNSNYWLNENYLGLGPSAHSYNGTSRQWNVSNNSVYIQSLENNKLAFEKEDLSADRQYNEYILTSLRTMWGTNLETIKQFGNSYYELCLKASKRHLATGDIIQKESHLFLSDKGKLLADRISSDLFVV